MNARHPACSRERDIEMDVTNMPYGITADSKRGRGRRLRFNEHLLDAEHWHNHFTYSLRQILLTHFIGEKPNALFPVMWSGNDGAET